MNDSENSGPLSGSSWDNSRGFDASAYGGKEAGFDPSYNQDTGEYVGGSSHGFNPSPEDNPAFNLPQVDYQKQLGDMFKQNNPEFKQNMEAMQQANGNLNQWTNGLGSMYSQDPSSMSSDQQNAAGHALKMANTYGESDPSMLRRLGVVPGMSKDQFFNQETPMQRDDRMGLVGNAIGTVGSAMTSALMPAPFSMGLSAYKAYNNYQKTGDLQQSIGQALGSAPGYFGAAGQALQGNYGSALSGTLGRSGVGGNEASLAGLGLDKLLGKDVSKPMYGLGGSIVGNKLGGPVGGVFGSQLGKSLASIFGKK